jgi:hypothetical protein
VWCSWWCWCRYVLWCCLWSECFRTWLFEGILEGEVKLACGDPIVASATGRALLLQKTRSPHLSSPHLTSTSTPYLLPINYLLYNHNSTVIFDIAQLLQHSSLNAGSTMSAAPLLPSSVPTKISSTWTYKYEAACAKQAKQLAEFDDDCKGAMG